MVRAAGDGAGGGRVGRGVGTARQRRMTRVPFAVEQRNPLRRAVSRAIMGVLGGVLLTGCATTAPVTTTAGVQLAACSSSGTVPGLAPDQASNAAPSRPSRWGWAWDSPGSWSASSRR